MNDLNGALEAFIARTDIFMEIL